MTKSDIIAGLDIGSANIRLVVCQNENASDKDLKIIGAVEEKSQGLNKGTVNVTTGIGLPPVKIINYDFAIIAKYRRHVN